jgi:Tol biopolymer transport system component
MAKHLAAVVPLLLAASAGWSQTVTVQRLSIGPDGDQSISDTVSLAISGDAHFAAFCSRFSSDTTTQARYFIRDVSGAQTQRVLVDSDLSAVEELRMSDDGRYVAYQMNQGGFPETKVRDRQTGTDLNVDEQKLLWLSHNGRWLVTGKGTDSSGPSVILTDLVSGAVRQLDLDRTGHDASGDWQDVYVSWAAAVDDSGRWLAYTREHGQSSNGTHTSDQGTYLYDLVNATAIRIAADSGTQHARDLWITPDGHYLAFVTVAEGPATVRVYDRVAGFSHRVSNAGGVVPNGNSTSPSISNDGHFVAFSSVASNIVTGDTNGKSDIFRFDRPAQKVLRVSVTSSGAQGNGDSFTPNITADGSGIAFVSDATNFVSGDTNGVRDAFLDRIQADAVPQPSPEPPPAPPAGGGSKPSDSGGTTPTPGGSGSSSSSSHHCGFGAGWVVAALLLMQGSRRRGR